MSFVAQEMEDEDDKIKFLTAEAPPGFYSLIFEARLNRSRYPQRNPGRTLWGLNRCSSCTKVAILTCQRRATTGALTQTVLGGSAGAVHREGHRNFCHVVGEDPSGSNDSRIHRCNTLTRRSKTLLSRAERAPRMSCGRQVSNPETQFIDMTVNVLFGDTETDADQPEDPEDW